MKIKYGGKSEACHEREEWVKWGKEAGMRKVITLFFFAFLLSGAVEKPEGYRIEVTKGKGLYEGEVRFGSPDGRVVKVLEWEEHRTEKEGDVWHTHGRCIADVHEGKGLVLDRLFSIRVHYPPGVERDMPEEGERWDYSLVLYRADGREVWRKSFRVYPGDDLLTTYYWRVGFSSDGNVFFVYYRDSAGVCNIEVYDTLGRMVSRGSYVHDLSGIEISSDGKIVGAETLKKIGDRYYRHLFFVDVETGRTKLVKAEGEINGKRWTGYFILSSTPKPPPSGKIRIVVDPHLPIPGGGVKTKDVSFDEIPSDLSVLFEEGGEK